jgi:hypothetical protein
MKSSAESRRHSFTVFVTASIYEGHQVAHCEVARRAGNGSIETSYRCNVDIEELALTGWSELADAMTSALVDASFVLEGEADWTRQHRLAAAPDERAIVEK